MGQDVQLYALVEPTPEQMETALKVFNKHNPIRDEYETNQLRYAGPELSVSDYVQPDTPQWPRVEVETLQRYSSPGYRMWAWPSIYQAIRLLQACFPESVVCYGSDSLWWGEPVTEEYIEEMWAAWYRSETDG